MLLSLVLLHVAQLPLPKQSQPKLLWPMLLLLLSY
jgi:hypothetical protein